MSVQTEIDRIITAVQAAHEKVVEKGGTTTQPYLVGNLASAIDTIPDATEPVLHIEYEIVNLTEESTSIPFTLKRVTSTFGMVTAAGKGGVSVKNVSHYNLNGMSASPQGAGSVASFLRPLYFENSALASGTSFIVPYVAVFINDPSAEALYEE